jgi:hypothetical protein
VVAEVRLPSARAAAEMAVEGVAATAGSQDR